MTPIKNKDHGPPKHRCSRRDFLVSASSLTAGLTLSGALASVLAANTTDDFNTAYDALVKGADVVSDKIKLDIDAYIENGNMVFYRLSVDHPMKPDDYVKHVHLLSTENPFAHVARFTFSPNAGRAAIAGRMRLAKTQQVVALAELNDDRLFVAKRYVQVAIGGCET